MFYKKSSNVIFRKYNSFGYITDNRNFGYIKKYDNKNDIGDKILSASGAVFFSVLETTPQALDDLAKKINKIFNDVGIDTIKNDAKDFYLALEGDKFVVSGKTLKECEEKDTVFLNENCVTQYVQKKQFQTSSLQNKSPQDFFKEYFNGSPQLTNIHIEITSKCNERCIHCYIPHENKTDDITPSLFHSIIKQAHSMGVLHLTLSGGEPMLHKNFLEFLVMCREYNFSVNILSNLTLLNDDIIKEMKKNPLLGVQTSLYSTDHSIHDNITQKKGSLKKTKYAILKLIESDIAVQISCPIMNKNRKCYEDVVRWADAHNIHTSDDHVIIASYDYTAKNLSCRLSIDEVKRLIHEKSACDPKYLEKIKIESDEKKEVTLEDAVCSVCKSSICIAENGNVYPCAGWQGYVVGNVKESSLSDIWEHSEKVAYLRALRKRDFNKCIQCADKEFCDMCMVRNANESPSGDPFEINKYFCDIAGFYRKIIHEEYGK